MPAFNYNDANKFLDVKEFCLCDVSTKEKKYKTPLFTNITNKEHPYQIDNRKQHISDTNNEMLANTIDNYFKGISSFNLEDFELE